MLTFPERERQLASWLKPSELSTEQLCFLASALRDELASRASVAAASDTRAERLFRLAVCKLSELRAYLLGVRALELNFPAASVPDSRHGVAEPGASIVRTSAEETSTTAGAAGELIRESFGERVCDDCGWTEFTDLNMAGICRPCAMRGYVRRTYPTAAGARSSSIPERWPGEVHRGPGNCVLCGQHPGGPHDCDRPARYPGTPSSSPSEHQPRGQRGPKGAEGAGAARRAEQGPGGQTQPRGVR